MTYLFLLSVLYVDTGGVFCLEGDGSISVEKRHVTGQNPYAKKGIRGFSYINNNEKCNCGSCMHSNLKKNLPKDEQSQIVGEIRCYANPLSSRPLISSLNQQLSFLEKNYSEVYSPSAFNLEYHIENVVMLN